jgi:myo-inositol-1(or 4)-monophosphatase
MDMNRVEYRRALEVAVKAAWTTGRLLRRNLRSAKTVLQASQHDLKIELDLRCQNLITARLLAAFPGSAVLGEEAGAGDAANPVRWVVDPIDGTVNFAYGIPHACVSIALQVDESAASATPPYGPAKTRVAPASFQTVVGVVYDPFADELWTAVRGARARLNGRTVRVSGRRRLDEAMVCVGFGKQAEVLDRMLPAFADLVHRVRKIRIMGSAALALTYVASGRFDAYLEPGVRLWDIAAGGLIVECAGGSCQTRPLPEAHTYELLATNGRLDATVQRYLAPPSPRH